MHKVTLQIYVKGRDQHIEHQISLTTEPSEDEITSMVQHIANAGFLTTFYSGTKGYISPSVIEEIHWDA